MKDFYIKRKHILIVSAYVLLTALLFCGGYVIGVRNGGGIMVNSAETAIEDTVPETEPVPSPSVTGGAEKYRLIIEDSELRLYCDRGGVSRLVSNETISESSFPAEDIGSLKAGESFDSLDDALAQMENFLS